MATKQGLSAQNIPGTYDHVLPSGAFRSTMDRPVVNAAGVASLTSGRLSMQAIHLNAGERVTSISFMSGSTAGATLTHIWFALYSSALSQLGVTADDTSASWATNTVKNLALSSVFTVPTTGLYYVAICVVGTTVPTLMGSSSTQTSVNAVPPIASGVANTGLTTPSTAPATSNALSALLGSMWSWVS